MPGIVLGPLFTELGLGLQIASSSKSSFRSLGGSTSPSCVQWTIFVTVAIHATFDTVKGDHVTHALTNEL